MDIKTNKIESPFQLLKTFISNFSFVNNCLDYNADADGTRTIDVGYKIIHSDKTNKGDFIAVLELDLNIEIKTISGDFILNAAIQGIFTGDSEHLEEEAFNKYLKVNGCSALYSILRGSVSSITSQAFSSGNVIIPMVNFIRFHEIVDKK